MKAPRPPLSIFEYTWNGTETGSERIRGESEKRPVQPVALQRAGKKTEKKDENAY